MNERKQKTILLVDNNSVTAAEEKKNLEKYGYIVHTAARGKEAIDIFHKTDDIDLILMDVDPGGEIDGAAAAEIILKDREVPIVFLSADTEFEVAKITEKIMSYGFAAKNSGTGVLDAAIKTALKLFDLNSKNKENKEKIEALQLNEERLRFALEKKFVGVWDLDLSDYSAVRSAEYDLIFGYKCPPPTWTYELFLEHVVPEERAAVNQKFEHALETDGEWNFDCRIRGTDRKTRWIHVEGHRLPNGEGKPYRMIGTVEDITESKIAEFERTQAEEALRLTEARYLSILEDQRELICRYLPDGRLSFVNTAYAWYYKKQPDELINQNFIPHIPEPDLSMVLKKIAEISKDTPSVTYTHRIITGPAHETRWQCWTQTGIYSPDGRLIEFQAVGDDITERKLDEEKIKALLEEKEVLLKEVHHRIKNNMHAISGLMSLQTAGLNDKTAVEAISEARNRVVSMMVLYDKLYCAEDCSKISFKSYFTPLVDEIICNYPSQTVIQTEKNIDDFTIDSKRLSQLGIITNEIITNIMKYAFRGMTNGLITLTARDVNRRAVISIQDNGVGLPESKDLSSSDGFGLKLIDIMARQLKGAIRVERDKGTKFVVEFNL